MLHRLSLGLLASAISVASLTAIAQEEGSADDLGVISVSLKDVIKPTLGFQGALQGAGIPNQAGIGGLMPLSVGDNSVFFADANTIDAIAKDAGFSISADDLKNAQSEVSEEELENVAGGCGRGWTDNYYTLDKHGNRFDHPWSVHC